MPRYKVTFIQESVEIEADNRFEALDLAEDSFWDFRHLVERVEEI